MTVEERIAAFRADLPGPAADVVRKHITTGECAMIEPGAYYDLKDRVSRQFGIHPAEVVVIGSARLGFSVAPEKRYRPFGETSDIDVVLCSSELFDAFWKDVFDYWARREIWYDGEDFKRYLFRGWMRPDKLPPQRSFARSQDWWEFFRTLTSSGVYGPYKIRGALYKNWHFLETYQQECVVYCKAMEAGEL